MSKPIPYEIIPRTELAVYKIYGVREHSSQIPKYKCFNKVDISNNIFLIFAKKKLYTVFVMKVYLSSCSS